MAEFLLAQLDFIYFFYGFAFLILGGVCFAIARGQGEALAWSMLGAFALLHGACEWLDLAALVVGDQSQFALVRVALNMSAFMLLLEFGRLEAGRFGLHMPGRWVYGPLCLAVILGAFLGGAHGGSAVVRYFIGFPGALLASWSFFMQARGFSGRLRRLAILGGVTFLLYSVAAGLVPPAAPFYPANVINHDWFVRTTGVPIQLVRGVLALMLAYAIWVMWGRLVVSEMDSDRYTLHAKRQYFGALITLAAILVGGWMLTNFFGETYKRHVENEGRGGIELLSTRLNSDTAAVDGMVRMLAQSPSASGVLTGGVDVQRARAALELAVQGAAAEGGAIYDRAGALIVSSKYLPAKIKVSKGVTDLLASTHGFVLDAADQSRRYYSSAPILAGGAVVGTVVLDLSLAPFDATLEQLVRPSFLIDPNGVVMLSNRPDMFLRTLWPLPASKVATLTARYGRINVQPVVANEVINAAWVRADGRRNYVRRRLVANGPWSVVMMTPPIGINISRVLGIFITFLVTLMVLIYLLGREHAVRDHLQMTRRLKAQKMARDPRYLAAPDALTGLYNRLTLEEFLEGEIRRARHSKTQFSLIIYDVDHLKQVNDSFGYQAGDAVLVKLSQLVGGRLRSTDLLARWDADAFAILAEGADVALAAKIAETLRAQIAAASFDGPDAVSCSFGVAAYVAGESAPSLIARAEGALREAKDGARNRVVLAPAPNNSIRGPQIVAASWANALRTGLSS